MKSWNLEISEDFEISCLILLGSVLTPRSNIACKSVAAESDYQNLDHVTRSRDCHESAIIKFWGQNRDTVKGKQRIIVVSVADVHNFIWIAWRLVQTID